MQVSLLKGATELAALLPEWEALAAGALEPNPAYEPWMLLPALEAFGDATSLAIVAVRDANGLVGLFPLQRERRYRGLPLHALTSWRHGHFRLGVPLVLASRADEVLKALLQWARRQASVIELDQLTVRESSARSLYRALTISSKFQRSWGQFSAFYTLATNYSDDDNERSSGGTGTRPSAGRWIRASRAVGFGVRRRRSRTRWYPKKL